MAWWNGGNWLGPYDFDDFAQVLHELCTALNEREKLLGMGESTDAWTPWYEAGGGSTPLTKFYIKDGSQKTFPTADDFRVSTALGATLADSDGYVARTLARLRGGIGGLVNPGMSESSGAYHAGYAAIYVSDINTAYTLSSLLSAGSYGSSWVAVTYHNDPDIWDQIREALELLTTVMWIPTLGAPDATYPVATTREATHAVRQTAWDNAKVAAVGLNTYGIVGWYSVYNTPNFQVKFYELTSGDWRTEYTKGALLGAVIELRELHSGIANGAFTITVDGSSYSTHDAPAWPDSLDALIHHNTWAPVVGSASPRPTVSAFPADDPATGTDRGATYFYIQTCRTPPYPSTYPVLPTSFSQLTRLTTDISNAANTLDLLTYG